MTAMICSANRADMSKMVAALPSHFSAEQKDFFQFCIHRAAHLWIGTIDEELVGLWGLIPPTFLSNWAYLWLYHTGSVKGREFVFIRQSRIAMQQILAEYPVVCGHAEAANASGIRWLRWLGAEFAAPEGLMIPFVIRRP